MKGSVRRAHAVAPVWRLQGAGTKGCFWRCEAKTHPTGLRLREWLMTPAARGDVHYAYIFLQTGKMWRGVEGVMSQERLCVVESWVCLQHKKTALQHVPLCEGAVMTGVRVDDRERGCSQHMAPQAGSTMNRRAPWMGSACAPALACASAHERRHKYCAQNGVSGTPRTRARALNSPLC